MLTTRTDFPLSSNFALASTTSCNSEPAPSKMMSAGLPAVSAITYPPRRAPLAGANLVRSRVGTFWRESASRIGPCVCVIATRQASTASLASPGRITVRWGIARREATCSTGSWVGPSSPTPIESCVKTKTTCSSIRATLDALAEVGERVVGDEERRLSRILVKFLGELDLFDAERIAVRGRSSLLVRAAVADDRVHANQRRAVGFRNSIFDGL